MATEKRFNVGDILTYKRKSDCSSGKYKFGGICKGNQSGEIMEYDSFSDVSNCWNIRVTIPGGGSYKMLESEFLEYNQSENPNYSIF